MNNIKIKEVIQAKDLVKVIVDADNFYPVTFIFSGYHIACFGDIESFVWSCTWRTAESILKGVCHASEPWYFTEKLEHKRELKEFDEECFMNKMNEIKEDYLEGFDTEEERTEFLKKWEDNEFLLHGIDGYRLGDLDEFFYDMDIQDYYEYYDDFYKLPAHYDYALEFLVAIENYFKELNKNEKKE